MSSGPASAPEGDTPVTPTETQKEFYNTLTPEQQKQYQDMTPEMQQKYLNAPEEELPYYMETPEEFAEHLRVMDTKDPFVKEFFATFMQSISNAVGKQLRNSHELRQRLKAEAEHPGSGGF